MVHLNASRFSARTLPLTTGPLTTGPLTTGPLTTGFQTLRSLTIGTYGPAEPSDREIREAIGPAR